MPEYQTPTDIANRALQHIGAKRISLTAGFTEDSRNAGEISSCYGKLRRAELARNVWTRATKKACLRPIDTNTLHLTPTLFEQATTYFQGSVVADASGTIWESRKRQNIGNDPQNSASFWQPYFGPLTVEPYDSSTPYWAGELVYTLAGDGTYNVFRSLISGNVIHPAMPNLWSTDTTYFKDQVVIVYPAWSSATTYAQGATVLYTDGFIYSSLTSGNVNNIPSSSGTNWALMATLTLQTQQVPAASFAPIVPLTQTPIDEWNEQTTYSAGGFVLFNSTIYLAIAAGEGNFPNASGSTFWVATTGGIAYMSLIDVNLGNSPGSAPALWSSTTTYATNNTVGASDGFIYKSLSSSNVGNNPVTDGGVHWTNTNTLNPWTTVFTQGQGNQQWLQIGGASFPAGVGLTVQNIIWPLGAGPAWQTWSRNVYRLPSGYLGKAPQDPKAGSFSWLGTPSNRMQDDWEYDGNYLITSSTDPIIFRFVADIQDVSEFPDMFCEGLACRIALEVCEALTQSNEKVKVVGMEYEKFMGEARLKNMIEQGADQPPLDDFIACRL